jgi:hypothetical protein
VVGVSDEIEVMILVKAAPVLTSRLDETMCVAAVALGDNPRWVRLHPVPFRDLADDLKFKKYQIVRTSVAQPKGDRRPESLVPLHGTLELGRVVATTDRWVERRRWVDALGEHTMCDLVEANRSGSGAAYPRWLSSDLSLHPSLTFLYVTPISS